MTPTIPVPPFCRERVAIPEQQNLRVLTAAALLRPHKNRRICAFKLAEQAVPEPQMLRLQNRKNRGQVILKKDILNEVILKSVSPLHLRARTDRQTQRRS